MAEPWLNHWPWLAHVKKAVSGASDDGRTCTGIHGVQNIPEFTAENLQFLKKFIEPAGKNEKPVSGSNDATIYGNHESDGQMEIYIFI